MIHQVIDYLKAFKELHSKPMGRVLEIGSRSVQDQENAGADEIRKIFADAGEYIGIDLFPGKNVDIVMNGHDIKEHFEEASFDLVICCETLEHDDKFWVTIENMKWALKPGGWMIVTVPGQHCPLHEWPSDFWRFMKQGVYSMFDGMAEILVGEACFFIDEHNPAGSCAVMGEGMKP